MIDNSLNYCILASDGVWDCLNLDDISKIVQENKENFNNLAKIIVETAKRKASEDNISCIVIELNKKWRRKNEIINKTINVIYYTKVAIFYKYL